jgi:tetratricopeptide (TPR) repeat protein
VAQVVATKQHSQTMGAVISWFQSHWLLTVGVGLILIVVGFIIFQYFADRNNYNNGRIAYQQANCTLAINYFDKVIDRVRLLDLGDFVEAAVEAKAPCTPFQVAVDEEQNGNFSAALVAYHIFLHSFDDEFLVPAANQRIENLVNQGHTAQLAEQALCESIDQLLADGRVPQPVILLPPFYLACGKAYQAERDYDKATAFFEQFLAQYGDHALVTEAEAALAQTIVANAKRGETGILPAPQRIGSAPSGVTKVVIQNDSPHKLRLVFSGAESHIEELDPCPSCQDYLSTRPTFCPEEGPIGRYSLIPGKYDVVVEAINDQSIVPFTGTWDLTAGGEYSSCFFIVITLGP